MTSDAKKGDEHVCQTSQANHVSQAARRSQSQRTEMGGGLLRLRRLGPNRSHGTVFIMF